MAVLREARVIGDRVLDAEAAKPAIRKVELHLLVITSYSIHYTKLYEVRMLVIGYAYGIRSERRLCEEVKLNLAYR